MPVHRRHKREKDLPSCDDNDCPKLPSTRGYIPITPRMIRLAVKELQMWRACVDTKLIEKHLRRRYPVQEDPKLFKEELRKKLDYAVVVGLIVKTADEKYQLPTLRQEANSVKTAFTAFWEMYKKNDKLLRNSRKKDMAHKRPGRKNSSKHGTDSFDDSQSISDDDLYI